MRTSFLFFVLLAGVGACTGPAKEPQAETAMKTMTRVEDSVYIFNSVKGTSHYYYSGKVGGNSFTLKDSQVIKFAASDPIFFLEATMQQIPFVLYAGDSLSIEKVHDTLLFRTQDPVRQHELNFFRDLVYRLGPVRTAGTGTYIKERVSLRERDSLIQQKFVERVAFLNDYQNQNPLSEAFAAYCYQALQSARLNEKLSLYYPGFNKQELSVFYRDSFPVFESFLNQPNLLRQTLFRDALHNYARYWVTERPKPWMFLEGLQTNQLLPLWDSVSMHLTGEVRAFMQMQLVKLLSHVNYPEANLQSLTTKIEYKPYKAFLSTFLDEKFGGIQAPTVFDQMLVSTKGNAVSLKHILSNDSITVLDFWASWCVPCIEEFSFTKSLEDKLRNQPVRFVRLSIDQHQSDWKEAVTRYQMNKDSYWIKGADQSTIVSGWKISSIPRFIIIKGNKVMDMDAPRPSDGNRLLEKLNALVK